MSNIQINSTPSRVQYTATSGQTEFSVPFPWNSNSDLKVYQRAAGSTAVDADDLLTEGTGAGEYGLTGAGTADGGTMTLVTGATTGDIITIVGDDPVDRDTIINTPTKLTNTTLNTQFNNLVIYCKQLETTINQLMVRYNNNESLDSGLIIDNILPYLTAGGVWRKNAAGTAIEVATLPTYPVGSSGADFSNDNRMVKTDTSGSDNAVQETGVSITDANNISGVADFTMTGTLTASGLIYPTSDGAAGQVLGTDGAGNLAFTNSGDGDVDGPASATDNAYARFDSASGKLIQNSQTTEDDSGNVVFSGTVTLAGNPSSALQAATKQYVDASSSAREWKDSVLAASDSAFTVTYDNGASGVGATLTNAGAQAAFSIDGQSPSASDRVLIKDQAAPAQNGIYTVTTVGDGATNWVLTRATDHDTAAEMEAGVAVAVDAGTVNEATLWLQTSSVTTVGTDSVSFTQFGSAGDVVGPASSTDDAIARFNGTTGEIIQNSSVTLSDAGVVSGVTQLNADDVVVGQFIQHSGDADNQIEFGTDTQDFQTGGSSRMDISDSGVRLGAANARVTTVLDEDDMASDSATALATQQSIKAYVDANQLSGTNMLNNGTFQVAQRGTSFNSTTTPANNDDTYLFDQWILLSDGNDIADVSRSGSAIGYLSRGAIFFDQETANKQWGLVQIIEGDTSGGNPLGTFRNVPMTFSFIARKESGNATAENIRCAIIEWTGTTNSVTSDVVGTWAGAGTNPTLATNWSYVTTPSTITLTNSFQWVTVSGTVGSSANNVAVFIWLDDTDATVGDIIYIGGAGLYPGSAGLPATGTTLTSSGAEVPWRSVQEELANCQRYLYALNQGTNVTYVSNGQCVSTSQADYIIDHKQEMRVAPTLTTSGSDALRMQNASGTAADSTAVASVSLQKDRSIIRGTRTGSGLVAGDCSITALKTSAYLWFSAEL